MGMIQNQGNWVPYELKPRDVKRRFFDCEQLLQSQNRKGCVHSIVTPYIYNKTEGREKMKSIELTFE